MTSYDPVWIEDWDTELQRSLVFNARRASGVSCSLSTIGSHGWCRAYKVCRVNLYFVAPLGFHFPQGHLGILEQDRILNVTETYRDA